MGSAEFFRLYIIISYAGETKLLPTVMMDLSISKHHSNPVGRDAQRSGEPDFLVCVVRAQGSAEEESHPADAAGGQASRSGGSQRRDFP